MKGYDIWKLDYPPYYDYEDEPKRCEGCDSEISEVIAEETDFCEDCLCDYDYDPETDTETECDGCIYCLCVADYEKAKANGTLK